MGVDARWLAARVAADDAAREITASTLLPELIAYLRPAPDTTVRMIDVGAGSGANQRWLAPRLPWRQHWVHLDHDPNILTHTHDVGHPQLVVGGIDALTGLLDDRGPVVITCAAVLDVVTRPDLMLLCDLIAGRGVPALLGLSVTGTMTVEPAQACDEALLAAFNDHQRRDGRAGPDATDLVVEYCRRARVRVEAQSTPWLLDAASNREFVARFLRERVDAAVEQDPALGAAGAAWLSRRLAQLANAETRITVGHRDLVLLP